MSLLPQNGSLWFAMRHGVRKARLGRPADQRKALLRGLVTELIRHGKIRTTKVRHLELPARHGRKASSSVSRGDLITDKSCEEAWWQETCWALRAGVV